MKLPEVMNFRETLHGHGAKGMYVYCYASTAGEGVHVEIRSERRGAPETKAWRHVALPDRSFATLEALKAAVEPLTDEHAAAERTRWPTVTVEPEYEGSVNTCRLCPTGPARPLARHRATVRVSWIAESSRTAGLCDDHKLLADDPAALIAALDQEVAERRARAAEKGLLRVKLEAPHG